MDNIPVADTRNFVLLGHTGSGKTSLVDAFLFKLGLNDRLGSVDGGTSMADYTDEEKGRKTTTFAKPFIGSYKTTTGKKRDMIFTDTPGYVDFYGQVIAGIRSAETGLIAIDASSGIQVITRRVWAACESRGLARAIVITGLDHDNTDFAKTMESIQSVFGSKCVPVIIPLSDKSGVVDVLASKDVPDDIAAQVEKCKGGLVELAAETDDTLIEKFIGGEELSPDEIADGLREAVNTGGLVPVFVCMSLKDVGVTELLDGICRLCPSPLDHRSKDSDGNVIPSESSDPFVGFVWKTVNDPFVGQLAFVKVIGGTLRSETEVFNATNEHKEKVGHLLLVNGKKQSQVDVAVAGDVVSIPKLKHTSISDTLCAVGGKTVCCPILFPKPVVFQAVTAKTQADEDKIGVALSRLCEEDQTLSVSHDKETKEVVLQGLGTVHIAVAVERMKSRSNVDVTLSVPKVPYRETVTSKGDGHYKHKKQSGGRGQYGEVSLRVEPKQVDDEEWFVNAIVGGVIPHNFIPAVQKGLLEGMVSGAVAGFPVAGIKVTLYDGSYHDVDSSEIAFKIAGARALREAMRNAKPVLLEPIMTLDVTAQEQYMGDINGDLNHKRGRIMGMSADGDMQVVTAEVPQSELFQYVAELRSITAGQGVFEMEMIRYDTVPANVTQKIVASVQKEKEE